MSLRLCQLLAVFLLSLAALSHAGSAPSADALVAELGLSEAPSPVSDHPGWQPRRVVVTLWPRMTQAMPDYEQKLLAAAEKKAQSKRVKGSLTPGRERSRWRSSSERETDYWVSVIISQF